MERQIYLGGQNEKKIYSDDRGTGSPAIMSGKQHKRGTDPTAAPGRAGASGAMLYPDSLKPGDRGIGLYRGAGRMDGSICPG